MQVDDPPYLSVGTAVSAKYKGAFCEAKVSKVVRIVKCKVTYKMGLGNATVSDEQIKGTLRVGQLVQAKHPDKKEFLDATITKIQDCSQYTVVFDDGDITTLKRTALCLKSGRHFNESETLDQLPLTHPEHFGNPVVGGRRGRRNRQLKEDSSDGELEEENEPDLEGYQIDIGRVVSVEATDKKRSKDNWFPGLVVIPSAQPTVRINVKDEYLVRSFKDGRYYTVPKKEVSDFNRELAEKVESSVLLEAVQKALKYLDSSELPVHWERSSLFNSQNLETDSEENLTDSSDDEPCEEKDRFVAQLYKFMDEAGTPLNKTPTVNNKDIDLHRLFRIVHKMGGYNRVTNQNKWRSVTLRLHLPNNQNTFNQVKSIFKKCLLSYEAFHRTLGVTMLNHTRSTKKNRGRSLIRDKDRATPVSHSPRPEKEDESGSEKKDEVKETPPPPAVEPAKAPKRKIEVKKDEEKKKKDVGEGSDTNSSDTAEQNELITTNVVSKDTGRPKRSDGKPVKERKPRTPIGEKVKSFVEKLEEPPKKDDDEKFQLTRSKSQTNVKQKEKDSISEKKCETKVRGDGGGTTKPPQQTKLMKKSLDEEKKRGRKRAIPEDKTSNSDSSTTAGDAITPTTPNLNFNIGDKLKVYYGPTHESKVTYEAKVIEIDKDSVPVLYLVHYTGWNTRYDEWVTSNRIAENLSAATKAKRLKQGASQAATTSKTTGQKMPTKRGRGMSITGRTSAPEVPRSTTPSSVTSSSSRTKSPATPATRSTSRLAKSDSTKRNRRTSAQTDVSIHSDSESDLSESETELSRTRSGGKSDESEVKTYKRKVKPAAQSNVKSEKGKEKDDNDIGKDSDSDKQPRRVRKTKISPEKSGEESDDEIVPAKGRDFDLNQIRSELKGFTKALKVPPLDASDKDGITSSDDSNNLVNEKPEEEEKKMKVEEKSCSDDIYEFKEPEPFEFESRPPKLGDDLKKRIVPRVYDDVDKSPQKKKLIKSPEQSDSDSDKKRFKRIPIVKQEDSEDDDNIRLSTMKKEDDPFDKLVESPSYNIRKPLNEKVIEVNSKTVRNIMEEPLFRDVIETNVDEYTKEIILSDSEIQAQNIFTRAGELFSDTYSKNSPDRSTLELEFPLKQYEKLKDSDDNEDDLIREQIERVIQQSSSTDEDSIDALAIRQPTTSYLAKKREDIKVVPIKIEEVIEDKPMDIPQIHIPEIKKDEPLNINVAAFTLVKQITPAIVEVDNTQKILIATKIEEPKKTAIKISDSILQKLNRATIVKEENENTTSDMELEPDIGAQEIKIETPLENKFKTSEQTMPVAEIKVKPEKYQPLNETRKRRKAISRQYILESDTDSSDSEQLIIARSDEDSQTRSLDNKDVKECDSMSQDVPTTDDSQPHPHEERNFKFEEIKKDVPKPATEEIKKDVEPVKEEEPDSQLHSLLLCEETLPRSPAPVPETPVIVEMKPVKTVLEMPFASAPGTSNSTKSMLLEHKSVIKVQTAVQQPRPLPPPPPQPVAPMVLMTVRENRSGNVAAVLDNTPPTTPESSISNLSPRGDNDNLSPNTVDNESCKSNEQENEYLLQRRNSANKVTPYSEEDTQMTGETSAIIKKTREDCTPPVKKRRKSLRGTDEVPTKRGRKPLNRSRHNSDSDDTSEHSNAGSINIGIFDRNQRSPRPSKYNFFVEFDPSLDSSQRIAVLQQKLSDLRKTYADVKAELAAVERRRKKIKRREREAQKASKQEMVCA